MKSRFGFILIKPQLGENIGACARSMKNFGFNKLYITSPKFSFPNHKTKITSVGAYDIIENTKVFNNTEEAIKEFDIIISLSARKRDINKKHITILDFYNILKKGNKKNFGLMFGPEASGLTNKDLSYSNYILQIPTSKKFKSLNLSHSVTIICYEIFKLLNKNLFKERGKKLRFHQNQHTSAINHLVKLLGQKIFLCQKKKTTTILNINNYFIGLELG